MAGGREARAHSNARLTRDRGRGRRACPRVANATRRPAGVGRRRPRLHRRDPRGAPAGCRRHEPDRRRAIRAPSDRRAQAQRHQMAVRTEANRLAAAVTALRNRALPSGPQPAARSREQLVIESSPLLRGEREEISLLDDRTRAHLEKLARVLDEYKTSVFKPRRLCLRRCLLWSKGL